MAQKPFGSEKETGKKLDVISLYLSMYQKALSGKFTTLYIDGFAGSGEIPLTQDRGDLLLHEEAKTVLTGSADRALSVQPPFSKYIFIDKNKKCIDALKEKFKDDKNGAFATYKVGDANEHIRKICTSEKWHSQRGVVLLDPFGSQVKWQTIEVIAQTKAVDLWYLFPAGLSIFRQIAKDGSIHKTHEKSITGLFGDENWKKSFVAEKEQPDLFVGSRVVSEKTVTPQSAALFMIDKMKSIFQGGVLDEMIPLGKHAYPSYYLLFAWGNPSQKAKTLANKLSQAAVRATDKKYGRSI